MNIHLLRWFAAPALALLWSVSSVVAADGDAAEPAPAADTPPAQDDEGGEVFDLSKLGLGMPANQPEWRKKLDEVMQLLQSAYMGAQAGPVTDEAVQNLDKAIEILADESIPVEERIGPTYLLGTLFQQFDRLDAAARQYERVVALGGDETIDPMNRDLFRGLGHVQMGELEALRDQPEKALERFTTALTFKQLPADFKSSILGRTFALRMQNAGLFDVEALTDLSRRELAWSVYVGQRQGLMADARLPGHLATVAALTGRADEARAFLALLDEERGESEEFAVDGAMAVAQAYAALKDAEGTARWLAKDLTWQATYGPARAPKAFVKYVDRVEKSHAFRDVAAAEPFKALVAEWRAKTAEAEKEERASVVAPPMADNPFGAMGME